MGEKTILEQYREGLKYLNGCSGAFTEEQLREYNRIIGNRLPEEQIAKYLSDPLVKIRGMEDFKNHLKATMSQNIAVFEKAESLGINLSS
jgi:hypothetical protein